MDTNDLVAHSRVRFDHHQARTLLKEKYQAKLNFAHNGGMFRAGPELITLLTLYPGQTIVLEDLYGNPIQVQSDQLLAQVRARWQEQMTAWFMDYELVSSTR